MQNGVFIKRGNVDKETHVRKMGRHKKITVYKPRRGAWNRFFPYSPYSKSAETLILNFKPKD